MVLGRKSYGRYFLHTLSIPHIDPKKAFILLSFTWVRLSNEVLNIPMPMSNNTLSLRATSTPYNILYSLNWKISKKQGGGEGGEGREERGLVGEGRETTAHSSLQYYIQGKMRVHTFNPNT